MSLRVSTGKAKGAPKHANKVAFTVNKYSFISQKIAALPVHGLCTKCLDVINWKKRMNKYKPLTQPKKCVLCSLKSIKEAYHVLCGKCAKQKGVCAKCQTPANVDSPKSIQDEMKENQILECKLESLNERQRRSYFRRKERGDDEGAMKLLENVESNEDYEDLDDLEIGSDNEESDNEESDIEE